MQPISDKTSYRAVAMIACYAVDDSLGCGETAAVCKLRGEPLERCVLSLCMRIHALDIFR